MLIHLRQLVVTFAHPWIDRTQRGLSFLHCTTGEVFRVVVHMSAPELRFGDKPRASR